MTSDRLAHLKSFQNESALSQESSNKRFSDDERSQTMLDIGRRLQEAFETDSLTIISEGLGTTPTTVKQYLIGNRFPAPEMLIQFNRSTGISIHWLMTGKGPKFINLRPEYSAEEEAKLIESARRSGRSVQEETKRLILVGLAAIESYQD